ADMKPGLLAYKTLVSAYVWRGDLPSAEKWFERAVRAGLKPDVPTYSALIGGYAMQSGTTWSMARAEELVEAARADGVLLSVRCLSRLLSGHAARGNLELATDCVDSMEQQGVAPAQLEYSQLLQACALSPSLGDDKPGFAERLVREMLRDGLTPGREALRHLSSCLPKGCEGESYAELCQELGIGSPEVLRQGVPFHTRAASSAVPSASWRQRQQSTESPLRQEQQQQPGEHQKHHFQQQFQPAPKAEQHIAKPEVQKPPVQVAAASSVGGQRSRR
ncbi:unnamed protein product, partial [Polarella glacialis]